jgi:hypothetical protein
MPAPTPVLVSLGVVVTPAAAEVMLVTTAAECKQFTA